MKFEQLARYRGLYRRAHRMGADRVLNRYVGYPEGQVVPVSVSHGVDMGHLPDPMDLDGAEPVHWAYNEDIIAHVGARKPLFVAPHPWLLLARLEVAGPDIGTLVVAAPPGRDNDRRLADALDTAAGPFTILVKPRGDIAPSMAFWRDMGHAVASAGTEGPEFYPRLYRLVSGARRVVGTNLSSALFFAAAIGKPVEMVRGYSHRTYSQAIPLSMYRTRTGRAAAAMLAEGDAAGFRRFAGELLGAGMDDDPDRLRTQYARVVDAIQYPVYFRRTHPAPVRSALTAIALRTGRVGILNRLREGLRDALFGRRIYDTTVDELAMWLSGGTDPAFVQRRVDYVTGVTEAGLPVDRYPTMPEAGG